MILKLGIKNRVLDYLKKAKAKFFKLKLTLFLYKNRFILQWLLK